MENFDNIIIPEVSELPPEAEAEQKLLQEQDIESLIVTPMISNDKLVGFVGFDWVEEQDVWSDEFINILCMVSELITTARRRKEREQELRELTSQYETLVENFPDGAVYLIDTDLECVRAGGEELSNVGLSPDDVEGTTPHALFPEDIADELCHYYQEALDGTDHTFEQEYGGERYRIQTVPVRTDDEKIDYVMAVSQNITERAEDKREVERQNERLEEFSSVVSHDLRNPLQVANGRLELIREEYESEHIDGIAQALDRMDALIEDLHWHEKATKSMRPSPLALRTWPRTVGKR
jgi:PAS domain S-box-containing protein